MRPIDIELKLLNWELDFNYHKPKYDNLKKMFVVADTNNLLSYNSLSKSIEDFQLPFLSQV